MRISRAITMGDVAAELKVMPTSPEVDLDALLTELKNALPERAEINDTAREDVAFGLVALIVMVVVPDDAGGTEAVEEAFAGLTDVESVQVENVTRL